MPKELPDISYGDDIRNPYVNSDNSMYMIPFYKSDEYFNSLEAYNNFISGVERNVRSSDRYSKYKSYLMNEIKLDHCQVLKDVTEEDCEIELHHGPIFTLYDVCAIILEYYRLRGWKITTFRIADTVLKEHELNHVNCVMLSASVHEQVHNRNIFINLKQAWGDINAFINKYHDAISPEYRMKYNMYIDSSILRESEDYGTFDLNPLLFQ